MSSAAKKLPTHKFHNHYVLLREIEEDRSSDISHNTATALKPGTTFTEVVVVEVLSKRSSVFLQRWLMAVAGSAQCCDLRHSAYSRVSVHNAAKHHGTTCLRSRRMVEQSNEKQEQPEVQSKQRCFLPALQARDWRS